MDDPLAELAAKSGCSLATYTALFGGGVDLSIYRGWKKSMARGEWIAERGKRTLHSPTLGGIHAAIDKAAELERAV